MHLVEGIEQTGDEGRSRTGGPQGVHQTEEMQVPDEAVGGGGRKGQREAPKIPLKGDDGHGAHTGPDHAEGRLATGQTRVEKSQTGHHDQHHGRGHDDVGLVAGLEPFVQVFRTYRDFVEGRSVSSRGKQRKRTRGGTWSSGGIGGSRPGPPVVARTGIPSEGIISRQSVVGWSTGPVVRRIVGVIGRIAIEGRHGLGGQRAHRVKGKKE